MTKKNFNCSMPNEHLESITFCELKNEDEGKVTSMDKVKYPAWFFTMCCYLMTL